ncbi:MAG TPA: DUF4344 domain-containing metallopeptidase [Kofleriaceae bacterium]|nr:DUF4344 domain-containing metallopeptidase [Kofleriaceae bacterium]
MTTRIGVVLLAIGLSAARAAHADGITMVETQGIEVALPEGWAAANKGKLTILAPTKFKGRAIEVMTFKGAPPATQEAMQKELGDKFTVTMTKEVDRNGIKVVIASANVKTEKGDATLDLLAMPSANGNSVVLMSFVAADQDPLLRKQSGAVLLSARTAGPRISVEFTAPKSKGVTAPPDNYIDAFKKLGPGLDSALILPRPLPIKFQECGFVNAFYSPKTHDITMCHELWTHFTQLFTDAGYKDKDLDEKIRGAMTFTFFHEFGHALHGELDLPVTAKGEDAADEIATLFLAQLGKSGEKIAWAGASWFFIAGDRKEDLGARLYDEHSLHGQRFGSIMCLLYGSKKSNIADPAFMKKMGFDAKRLAKCSRDYQARYKAWNQLLEPYHRKKKK